MKITVSQRLGKKLMALILVIAVMLSMFTVVFAETASAPDKTDINSYAPTGLKNIALNKTVTSSSSYEMANEGWCKAYLTDGILDKAGVGNGWTTNPYDKVTDPAVPASVGIDLGTACSLNRVVLFPCSLGTYGDWFPVDFKIQVSSDGKAYTDVYTATGIEIPAEPFIIDLPQNTEARHVQLYVSKRYSSGTNPDGELVQLSEIAVFGSITKVTTALNKNNLLLTPGMTDTLVPNIIKDNSTILNLSWKSSDENVATVDQNGVVTALSTGTATVTLSDEANGISETCLVTVTDTVKRPFDNIMISVFWPPTKDYVNDEQYSYLSDAKINYIQNVVTGNDLNDKAINLEMARLAYKYGMQVGIADTRFGGNLLKLGDNEIADLVNEYKNVPGVGGYYILDEPRNANPYARIYRAMKNADPNGYAHLNFLPNIYGSEKTYENQMNDWVKLASQDGHKLDCLIYDRYPFQIAENSMDYAGFLSNMASVWKVGLKHNVNTGTYLQSIGVEGAFRRTNGNEIRYEAYMALAFGFKQLSYFTWFTPPSGVEVFTDGIMKADGTKTDLFEPVKQLNSEILQLGTTLMQLDAKEVYLNGNTYGQKAVPADFFVHSQTNADLTFSYLRDKNTGRNYLMVVNNSFTDEKDISLKFADAITSLEEVDKADGSLKPVSLANGILNMHFAKGDGHLFALPVNYDYEKPTVEPATDTNLALNAQAYCSTSQGSGGYYMDNINDGIRFSDGSTSNGWQSDIITASTPSSIVIDLGAEHDFNRVDLYPAGDVFSYGTYMPKDFTIDISNDCNTWTTVETVTGLQVNTSTVPSYTFSPVKARYVRININRMNEYNGNYAAALAEIEIYNDNGTVPAAKPEILTDRTVVVYTPGMNIALHKQVSASSSTPDMYKQWGWYTDFVNDGLSGVDTATGGWSSNVGSNMSGTENEWVAIYFGDLFAVNKINVSPAKNSAFPYDYVIELSTDAENWVTAKEVTGDVPGDSSLRTFTLDNAIPARFIRIRGTKLVDYGRDGYLMQVGEIEAYGSPICNKDSLNAEIAVAEAAKPDNYSQAAYAIICDLIVEAKELSTSVNTTQTVANDMVKKLSAVLAGNYVPNENTINKVINPVKIDGVIDESGWKLNRSLDYKRGNPDNTAKAGLMWDDNYLYAAFDVTDANVVNSGAAAPWNDDAVEIYVNGDSSRGAYTKHTVQYIFRVNDDTVYKYGNDAAKTDGILKAFKVNANGYTLEVAIPWSDIGGLTVAKGKTISFTAHVDDKDVSDSSVQVADIIGLTDMSNGDFQDSSKWLEFTLTDTGTANDKAYLALMITQAEGLTEADYTINSWSALNSALTTANTVKNKTDAIQVEIIEAVTGLKSAMNGLETSAITVAPIDSRTVNAGTAVTLIAVTTGYDLTYKWQHNGTEIPGATESSLVIPNAIKDDAGTYTVIVTNGVTTQTVNTTVTVTYIITYDANGGSGTMSAETATEGATFTLPTNGFTAPGGKQFKVWAIGSASGTQVNAGGTHTFTESTTVYAVWENIPAATHTITYDANGGSVNPTSGTTGTDGRLPNLPDATRSGNYRFDGWFTAASGGTVVTTVTVFTQNSTIYAHWTDYSTGGGGSETPSTPPTSNVVTDKQPNMPTTAKTSLPGTVKDSILSATITEQMAKDAIKAARDAAKKSQKEVDGIALDFNVTGSGGYTNLNATIDAGAIDRLKEAGVKFMKIGSAVLDITIDAGAIAEIDKQSSGTVTVSATKYTKLSNAAKKLIGNRPVFDITVSYQKNGQTATISNFGEGAVTLGITYKATDKEKIGNLFGVYVDKNGKPQLLTNSSYDNGRLVFSRNSLSTYGVGHKAPAPAFTDTANHWAMDNIDFVAGRDLISGTSATTFEPNTAITRADFLIALGRLSGADVSIYKISSFADVKASDTAMPYIEWAVASKIVSGYGNGKFGSNDSITREQMAVMMQNYAKATGYKLPIAKQAITFADDAKISAYAKDAVKAIQQTGVINGKDNNRFDPQGNATRGEASTILRRFVELVIDEGTARGWVQNDAGQWQYIGENGKPVTGWLTEGKDRYYFPSDGIMVSGKWLEIDGKWYYFHADGSNARSTKVDGYDIGPDGLRKAR